MDNRSTAPVPAPAVTAPDRALWRGRLLFWLGALLVGVVGVAFAKGADWAAGCFRALVEDYPWAALVITPLTLVALVWASSGALKATRGSGIPQVMAALEQEDAPTRRRLLGLRVALGKMVFTIMALLGGASVGREGPSVHVGAALMHLLGSRFHVVDARTARQLILAGGAAGIAAAFNTPLAGVVFAIEELARAYESRFTGVVLTAVILAGAVARGLQGDYAYFGHVDTGLPIGTGWIAVPLLALVCGLAGALFARLILLDPRDAWARPLAALRERMPLRFALGCGLLLAVLGLLGGNSVYGTGYQEARAILQGEASPLSGFGLLKLLANTVSYWAGIPGGIFSPSLAAGAGIAHLVGGWLPDVSPAAVALLGMCAYLSGVTQAPLTSAVICMELTANQTMLLPVMTAALLARMVSRWICPLPVYHALALRLFPGAAGASTARPAAGNQSSGGT